MEILEAESKKIKKEYLRRTRKYLETKSSAAGILSKEKTLGMSPLYDTQDYS